MAQCGMAGLGAVRQGKGCSDLSAAYGTAAPGLAGQRRAWHGKDFLISGPVVATCDAAGFGNASRGEVRQGVARLGMARPGSARSGMASRDKARVVLNLHGGAAHRLAGHSMTSPGAVRQGKGSTVCTARLGVSGHGGASLVKAGHGKTRQGFIKFCSGRVGQDAALSGKTR